MAKPIQNPVVPDDAELSTQAPLDPDDHYDTDKIEKIIKSEDVKAGGKIRLERKGPSDVGYAFCCKIPADNWDIETIRKVWGGGDYRCMSFRSNGQIYKSFEFSIDHRLIGSMDEQLMKRLGADSSAAAAQASSNIAARDVALVQQRASDNQMQMMMQMMKMSGDKADQMMQMFMLMMNQQAQQAQASQASMVQMMTAMMTAVAGKSGIDPVIVELIKNQPVASSGNNLGQMADMFKLFKEISGGGTGEEEEQDMLSKITRLTEAAGPIIGGVVGAMRGKQPVPTQPPVNGQPPPRQVSMRPILTEIQKQIAPFIGMMLRQASKGINPELFLAMIVNTLDEEQVAKLQENLKVDNWMEVVFANDARIIQYAEWFTTLRQIIIDFKYEPVPTDSGPDEPPADRPPVSTESGQG